MKLYKIKLAVEPFYWYPFSFIDDWKSTAQYRLKCWKLKMFFNKLKWNDNNIWGMTSCSGSLNEAINTVSFRLLWEFDDNQDKRLIKPAIKLVTEGYENNWS